MAGRAVGGKDHPPVRCVTARFAKRCHAIGDEPFAISVRLGQISGECRHAPGGVFRETAFDLRIEQQPGRGLAALHRVEQRLGPGPVPGERTGKLQLQIGRRLDKRLGQAGTNDRQMRPAVGHGQAQRLRLPPVLKERGDAGLLACVAVAKDGGHRHLTRLSGSKRIVGQARDSIEHRRQLQVADDLRGGNLALGQESRRHRWQRRKGRIEATRRHPGKRARGVAIDDLKARAPSGKRRQVPHDLPRGLAAGALGFF